MKNGTLDKNSSLANHRHKVAQSKQLTGITSDKYPVIIDGGKTIIFISDKSKESETRARYELHRNHFPSEKSRT
jgi:hypothetical protein